jgi:hypothetical protein
MWDLIYIAVVYERASDVIVSLSQTRDRSTRQSDRFHYPNGRDEDYLCLVSELVESLRAMDNGPAIFNT